MQRAVVVGHARLGLFSQLLCWPKWLLKPLAQTDILDRNWGSWKRGWAR